MCSGLMLMMEAAPVQSDGGGKSGLLSLARVHVCVFRLKV